MSSYNRVVLLGNLTRDPETKFSQGGMAICKFGMAMNRKFTRNGEKVEEVCFVDVTAFDKTGKVVQDYVRKGNLLFVEGRLNFSTWEKDGKKASKLEVIADTVQLMPNGERREPVGGGKSGERVQFGDGPVDESLIPF